MSIHKIGQFLKGFSDLCSKLDKSWIERSRKIDTLKILQLLMIQVWSSGQLGVSSALMQLIGISSDMKWRISVSAISQARQRMNWSIIRELFNYSVKFYQWHAPKALWKGRRIFAIDGSRINLPSHFKNKKYMRNGKHWYYPQALITVIYQLKAAIPVSVKFSRHIDEKKSAASLLKCLCPLDVIVLDRGFFHPNLLLHA